MPIKLKKILAIDPSDPLQKHLESILSPPKEKKMEYAKKKLEVMGKARELIEKNTNTPEKKANVPQKTVEVKDNLTVLTNIVDKSAQENLRIQQQSIHEYLSEQAELRKDNQLVYGKDLRNSNLMGLGVGLAKNSNQSDEVFYKKKLMSTDNYIYPGNQNVLQGTLEFGITHDNKIFIVPKPDGVITNNLYKMAQGAFLKAVGCMQIGNREIEEGVEGGEIYSKILEGQIKYISVYNSFFDVPKDNIAISLFALKKLGIDLNHTQVVVPNDEEPLISSDSGCNIRIHGNLENASYYLNEKRFLGAKALAEKKSNFSEKIIELFHAIDDELLSTRNKKLIKDIYQEKQLLKLHLIKLFNCIEELEQPEKKRIEAQPGLPQAINQPSTSLQAITQQISVSVTNAEETLTATFNDCWQVIKASWQVFKENNIDLSFVVSEIYMILAYLLQNGLTSNEKDQLKEWVISEIPGRGLDPEAISDYIRFYEHDPIKTCIALLQNYSKGHGWPGVIYRFFSGAWKRNYKDSVNEFLSIYNKNELPDNINICDIYEKLKDSGLIFNYDAESKSSLREILLFCAKLHNEESSLLYKINTLSITSFPPLDSDNCGRCNECCY